MELTEAVSIATSSLWAHKLRSVLTLIGVVIGVTSVIAVVSLINGANQYVATRVFRLGADVFGLSKQPSIVTNVDDWLEFQKRKRITFEDFEAVRDLCQSCKEVGAALGGRVEAKSGVNSLKDTNLRAWTPQMAELYDVDLVAGRPGLSPKNVKALEGEAGLKVFSVPDTTCHFLCMNQKKPPFDNKLVRQAVNYAIPIQAILPNVLFGYGTQMKSPVPNLTPTYLGDYSPYKHDIAKAKALMKEAGMDRAPIPVDLAIRVGWPTHEQASVWLQRELEQIGFKVNIVKETDATFRQLATKGDHQLSIEAWQSWINDPFYHLTFLFNSKSKFTNLSAYSNPAVDKLIDENMHETNRDKRAAASRNIQKLVLDDAVWGLLWYENWTRVGTADLVGLEKRWDTFERYYSLKRT